VIPAGIGGYFSGTIKIWVKMNLRCWCLEKVGMSTVKFNYRHQGNASISAFTPA